MSILVIDDNTLLLSKIVRSLVEANHKVHTANSLKEARQALEQELPQVLCLDLQLPDGNGLDLVEELRQSGEKLPVVIISGQYSEEQMQRAEQLGVARFFNKPFALQDLSSTLSELLGDANLDSRLKAVLESHEAEKDGQPHQDKLIKEALSEERILNAKRAYTTRHIDLNRATQLIRGNYKPQVGDLVLARVKRRRQHQHLQLPTGRRAIMFAGDEIIVCYGNRYAPDQFESEIPEDLSPCNLVAAGGIASNSLSRNNKMKPATEIEPIGVLADQHGHVLNMKDNGLSAKKVPDHIPPVTIVVGTSMNAGKTTVAADLILGMRRSGLKVGAAKVTGTGAGGDVWRMVDAGAQRVLDFSDFGYPTTYKVPVETCITIMETLVAELCEDQVDHIVIEVADGILQTETKGLIQSPEFARLADKIVFAAGDAMGALAGTQWLQEQGLNVVGISGVITSSPLAMRECMALTDLPVFTRQDLNNGEAISRFIHPGAVNLSTEQQSLSA